METKRAFFLEAYKLGIIKFGRFTLKSGIESPFYVDLRPLASDPKILKHLSNYLLEMLPLDNFDLICGVPYAALPMATAMSLESYIPLIIKRKEAKAYGTKKLIEGIFQKGQNCLLVEDVITSGKSLLETIDEVENEGLNVSDIVVVLDRQQGGREKLQEKGYNVHTLFTISEVVEILQEEKQLMPDEVDRINDFLNGNVVKFEEKKKVRYEEKLNTIDHPVATKLLEIAIQKRSNLIASADVITTQELLNFAEIVGPHIAALKTHIDIITDFDYDKTIIPLKDIAAKHNFLLMEDRKFGDIGNTQELQFSHGIYKIANWADMITAHAIGGSQALEGFHNAGIITILGMSSKGTLTDAHYREEAMKIIINEPNVMGCVAQNQIQDDLLLFTPGVNLSSEGDSKGQQYNTPEHVFKNLHTDFIIVGRGIYKSDDIEKAALTYRTKGWMAYEAAIS
ncbi:orotidine-5'-phosphate decarboxylase [Elizabethkingia meningoseptica]|uniref:Orotate phosphoribosyltransferase n=1 Tax=Elizabethkingia meningoseptica TaxID=238 RepID=A0A1T3F3S3_ELIME|nr:MULTISPECIES: orotidine-5'-phosphate decarboxylase [Elizabethkingia]AQX03737.1 orotidine 5'-phosphate decarboxylase [Elizabethkingia meningoseptica]AQX11184.1 orotidine 5'-phosphate decarboxylase [Elizabethkingia meningoseptica]AQX45776.1 orotidine 5'-phosphate decarboxylase [Elizabethkingia meningoseptica]EJK5329918.1 orotate phosphoribosyltransferase [Elizabethkingia meningoseptica]EOR29812.1 Orotate phosphoribosyltransferase [Elizabethkingia meningoseptica ATCC 13253 = NBRC 12535]